MNYSKFLTSACGFSLCAITMWPANSQASSDISPHTPPPQWVEQEFENMMKECLPGESKIKFKKGKPKEVNFLPLYIKNDLALPSGYEYQHFSSANMTRHFGYIYNQNERNNLSNFIPETQRYLNINYDRDGDQLTEAGLGELVYDKDCGGVLSYAAELNAGGEFASATLSAAVKSAMKHNFSSSIQLAKGYFTSPLPKMWNGTTDDNNMAPAIRMYAALLLWDWYKRNGVSSGNYALLNSTHGISLYRFTTESSSAENSASANAKFAIPFFSAQGNANGRLERSSELKLNKFIFAHTVAPSSVIGNYTQFWSIPNISQVVAQINGAGAALTTVRLALGEDDIARAGLTKNLEVDIRGLPFQYCSRELTVRGIQASNLSVGTPQRVDQPDGIPICRIPMRYSVPESGATTQLNVTLSPSSTNLPTGVIPFAIPVVQTFADNSDRPKITELPNLVVASTSTPDAQGNVTVVWETKGRLIDDGLVINDNSIDKSGLGMIDCPADIRRLNGFSVSHELGDRISANERPITFKIESQYRNLDADWQASAVTCRISGKVAYQTTQGTVTRLLDGFEIRVPAPQ